ncbi:MAG: hypothetical protein B6229_07340 [Spirochaetaceae bacterium 4572_7]|nr:MAG: hypothetical protein B6229_07340 [Spirochaetaceae bacterium 4572_7]
MSSSKKLNILIIPSWYPSEMDPNGVPYIRAQAQALVRAGHKVTVVFTQSYSLNLKKLMELDFNPDIVHIHTYLAGNLGIWFSQKYNIPLITTEHYTGFARGIIKSWELKLAKKLYHYSIYNIGVSTLFASLLTEMTGADFKVLPNMVNTDLFTLSVKNNNRSRAYTYLYVGYLHKKKNITMLLNAFTEIHYKNKSSKLIIVGEGIMFAELKEIVKINNLENVVSFPGFLEAKKVALVMNDVDSFILPSQFETFGIVVIEAMASGLPVVVTKSGGPETFVQNGINGIVINQDQKELEKALVEVREKGF